MASFRRAVELGATFIETDLRISHDARFVAMHDATLDRTTNGRGLARDFTLAQLRELDAGSWYGAEFAGERIPTLDEILNFAREADVVFYLEIKHESGWGVHHGIAGALRAANDPARTVVISFEPSLLEKLRKLDAGLLTGFLFETPLENAIERAQQMGVRQILPRADLVTRQLLSEAKDAGLQVVTWTVNEPAQMERLISMGVNGIMSDFPDRLRAVVERVCGTK
jgi:glycerophosphoryl diester phosphodiesterase